MSTDPIITFTSDFGTREYYVGAVHGAILSVCPRARIVDISHELTPHGILEGAFTLLGAYACYPANTVHLAVVDPGVGSSRKGIIVCTDRYRLVGPDNGIFSLIYQREKVGKVVSIESDAYFRKPVSPTFHGRDIFGPVAAQLACETDVSEFGPEVQDYQRIEIPSPRKVGKTRLEGAILRIDRFGNAITNISPEDIRSLFAGEARPRSFFAGGQEITAHYRYYAQAERDEVFSLLGSSGYYEIAAQGTSAARLLNLAEGARVEVEVEII